VPEGRFDQVLETVDMTARQKDKVKSYSLGMKQRLGLAIALLNDPEILVLDEPANGLDPAGIVEMRDLLRHLVASGKSIFISSHVLAEVQQICDRVAIINLGRLVRLARVSELVESHGEFTVRVEDTNGALAAVQREAWGRDARVQDGVLLTKSPTGRGRDLVSFLVSSGYVPDTISEHQQSLEQIFLSLTGGVG
jgi:ABC-2 type transport system ATP-binding protein